MAGTKRRSLADMVKVDTGEPVVDTRPEGRLLKVPVARIAPNKVNERRHFGDLDVFGASLRRKQLQPIRCVSRGAYLQVFPEHADDIGHVDLVLVNGERRYRAALQVGLEHLEAVVDDAVAETRQDFKGAVLTENVEREDFNPIEEAHAIKSLVDEFGTAGAVAEHFERSNTWVSQRLAMLQLTTELQELVVSGELPVRAARELARLRPNEQAAAWETEKAERDRPRSRRRRTTNTPEGAAANESSAGAATADTVTPTRVPKSPPPGELPWESPAAMGQLIRQHMTAEDRATLAKIITADDDQPA